MTPAETVAHVMRYHVSHCGYASDGEWAAECLAPGCEWRQRGPEGGAVSAQSAHLAHVAAEVVTALGLRECSACQGSGLYPNPTGVFYAPTELLGCPDCQGAGWYLQQEVGE